MKHSVNGGSQVLIQQPDTGSSSNPIAVPVKLNLQNGGNTLVFASGQNSELIFRSYVVYGVN